MKTRLVSGVLAVIAAIVALSVCAVAGPSGGGGPAPQGFDEVLYKGQLYCVGVDDCEAFAFWGPTAAGVVELLESPGGPVSDYIWVDFQGNLWFESDDNGGFGALPPAGLPLLGTLVESGQLQEVDQFFPGGSTRPLFIESVEQQVPEPSTLLLLGPAALFLFNRARRFGRG